jgi:acyl carrier protein
MTNIEQRLLQIVNVYKESDTNVHLDISLYEDLRLDSLSLTEMIVACEDEFKIEIDMDHPDTKNAKTVRDLYNGILVLTGSN